MDLNESARNLKASIPEADAKLCANCNVFFSYKAARDGKCPFCGSDATEFYLNYIKRLKSSIQQLGRAFREQAA